MCLIFAALHQHPDFPLIIAANRDEYFSRPTLSAHYWPDKPGVFAGRDLQAGGTWMGVNHEGRFGAVTNFRESRRPPLRSSSRGELILPYLSMKRDLATASADIQLNATQYAGFNLILGDANHLQWFCNRNPNNGWAPISPGIVGLSNGLMDAPWAKIQRGKMEIIQLLTGNRLSLDELADSLWTVLSDRKKAELHQLPNTGVDLMTEWKLSPRFISMGRYGTRSSTLVFFDTNNEITFIEREYNAKGEPIDQRRQQITSTSLLSAIPATA